MADKLIRQYCIAILRKCYNVNAQCKKRIKFTIDIIKYASVITFMYSGGTKLSEVI